MCPECGSPYLKKFGAGTQRVEAELVSVLEGGYAVRSLARSVMAHLNMLVMRGRTAR